MSFDIILPLNSQSPDREYLVVDVYTRFPLTHRIIDSFAKKIKKSKNCKGFLFARAETRAGLMDEHLGRWKDNFQILFLEYVRTPFLKSINVHEIEKKVVALSEASWYEVMHEKDASTNCPLGLSYGAGGKSGKVRASGYC